MISVWMCRRRRSLCLGKLSTVDSLKKNISHSVARFINGTPSPPLQPPTSANRSASLRWRMRWCVMMTRQRKLTRQPVRTPFDVCVWPPRDLLVWIDKMIKYDQKNREILINHKPEHIIFRPKSFVVVRESVCVCAWFGQRSVDYVHFVLRNSYKEFFRKTKWT